MTFILGNSDRHYLDNTFFFLSPLFFSLMIKCSWHRDIRPNTVKIESRGSNRYCMQMFTAALLTTAKRGKQPEYPSTASGWTKCGMHNITEHYSQKGRKFWHLPQHGWTLRTSRWVRPASHKGRTLYDDPHMRDLGSQVQRHREQDGGGRELGEGSGSACFMGAEFQFGNTEEF